FYPWVLGERRNWMKRTTRFFLGLFTGLLGFGMLMVLSGVTVFADPGLPGNPGLPFPGPGEPDPEPQPEPDPQPNPEPDPEPNPDPGPGPQPEPQPNPEP